MSWSEIVGHEQVKTWLQRAIVRQRLAGSYLFVGPAGVGKCTVALKVAQSLLCMARSADSAEPCGRCRSCLLVLSRQHPDLDLIRRPEGRTLLPIELFVGDREHRNQEGLCHRLALTPYYGPYRVAILDDADDLSIEGANVLLKTLEEPAPFVVIILIATSLVRQLPTIRSRCQIVSFLPLEEHQVADILRTRHLVEDAAQREQLAALASGSVQTALEWAESGMVDVRQKVLSELVRPHWDPQALAHWMQQHIEGAGKESAAKRRALRQMIGLVMDFFRQALHAANARPLQGDTFLRRLTQEALTQWAVDRQALVDCIDACLQADQAAMANAHIATLIDTWLDSLAEALNVKAVA